MLPDGSFGGGNLLVEETAAAPYKCVNSFALFSGIAEEEWRYLRRATAERNKLFGGGRCEEAGHLARA